MNKNNKNCLENMLLRCFIKNTEGVALKRKKLNRQKRITVFSQKLRRYLCLIDVLKNRIHFYSERVLR
jgi:hypothetical protein